MVSKMVRSMITTVINPFDGLISRYFVTLDPVLNSYYEVAQPITFAGDFEIEFEFSTTEDSTFSVILGNDSDIQNAAIFVDQDAGFKLRYRILGVIIYSNNPVNDGKLHKGTIKRTGTTLTAYLDGVLQGSETVGTGNVNFNRIGHYATSSYHFDGIIANAKFTDKSGASDVVTTFKLDNSPAAENYTYSTELLDNNTFPDNANARQYLVATKGWIITDGGAV